MPEPLHPPFASGSITIPRQLQRWLDINSQGGELTRSRFYLTLPAFSVSVNWIGVSDIVAAFNFESPKNFSIPCSVSAAPINVPVVFNVIDSIANQTGTVIGTETNGGIIQ